MDITRLQKLAGVDTKTNLTESSPEGREGTVKAMKSHSEIDNPWALAHYMDNQGYESHKNESAPVEEETSISSTEFDNWMSRWAHIADKIGEKEAFDKIQIEMGSANYSPDEIAWFVKTLEDELYSPDSEYDMLHYDNYEDDEPVDETLSNGYDDIHFANGDDYFPTGAESPVFTSAGPASARNGDNPLQKDMQVEALHIELVESYTKYTGRVVNK